MNACFCECSNPALVEPGIYSLTNVSKYLTTGAEFDFHPFVLMMQKTEVYAFFELSVRGSGGGCERVQACIWGGKIPWTLANADPSGVQGSTLPCRVGPGFITTSSLTTRTAPRTLKACWIMLEELSVSPL